MSLSIFKNLLYSVTASSVCNFLSGITTLYVILFWFPNSIIHEHDPQRLFMLLSIPIFVGILPALSYNLIRFRMVKSGELNYGMWRFAISTVLPFIVPMLIYSIAYLNGFRLN